MLIVVVAIFCTLIYCILEYKNEGLLEFSAIQCAILGAWIIIGSLGQIPCWLAVPGTALLMGDFISGILTLNKGRLQIYVNYPETVALAIFVIALGLRTMFCGACLYTLLSQS